MKKVFFCLAVVLAMLTTACSDKKKDSNEPRLVRLATVASAVSQKEVIYPGRTQASESVNMAFRVSGTLQSMPLKVGDRIKRGQLVAQMDDRDYKLQLAATQAEYSQVKAECERIIALYGDSATSANNYDKARYGLEQITAKLNNHQNQLADTRLYAPFNGYVSDVRFEAHETVAAGMPVISVFCSEGTEIVINIPASEYLMRDSFDSFSAAFDMLPGKTFPLKLLNISQKANANQLYQVRLLLEGDHVQITPGMTALVTLTYKNDEDTAMVINTNAIFNNGQGSQVFVYNAQEGKIHLRDVTLGVLHRNGSCEILGGLKAGEQIVISGVHYLEDGEDVQPMEYPSKTNVGGLL